MLSSFSFRSLLVCLYWEYSFYSYSCYHWCSTGQCTRPYVVFLVHKWCSWYFSGLCVSVSLFADGLKLYTCYQLYASHNNLQTAISLLSGPNYGNYDYDYDYDYPARFVQFKCFMLYCYHCYFIVQFIWANKSLSLSLSHCRRQHYLPFSKIAHV